MSTTFRLMSCGVLVAALTLLAGISRADEPKKDPAPHGSAAPKVLWTAPLGGAGATAPPAVAGDRVIVGSGMSGVDVVAFDRETGKKVWSYRTKDNGPGAIVLSGERVHFTTESCTHYAVDVKTGRLAWSVWLGDPVLSSPAVVGDRVYVSSGIAQRRPKGAGQSVSGVFLDCRDEKNGSLLWTTSIGREVIQAPVVVGDTVYCATMDGVLHAIAARTGDELWTRSLNAVSAPMATADGLFLSTDSGTSLSRLSLDGKRRWSARLSEGPESLADETKAMMVAMGAGMGSVPCVSGDRVYVGTSTGRVKCLSDADGKEIWSSELASSPAAQKIDKALPPFRGRGVAVGSPCVTHGRVYGGASDGTVWCASADDGEMLWSLRLSGSVGWSPVIRGGRVYVSSNDGSLTCIDAGDPEADGWGQWGGNATHTGGSGPVEPPVVTTPDMPEEE